MGKNKTYYISEKALSFTPNYQNRDDVVYVSVVRNAAIAVFDPEVPELGYDVNADYHRWKITASTTKLGTDNAYTIYARLSREVKEGTIIFSVNNYNIDGSIAGVEDQSDMAMGYWYINLGSVSAPQDNGGGIPQRTLTYDNGMLGTVQYNSERNAGFEEMFWYDERNQIIEIKHPVKGLIAKGLSVFDGLVEFLGDIKIFGRELRGIVGIPSNKTEADGYAQSEDTLVTPKFVKAYGDLSYLSKTTTDEAQGHITFNDGVTVKKEATINGTLDVKGLQTLYEGFVTDNFNDAAGQITGAQLTKDGIFTAKGIIAQSFEVMELIYNKIKAQGGKFVYSNSAVVETCVYNVGENTNDTVRMSPDEYYALNEADRPTIQFVYLVFKDDIQREKAIPFESGDILYGYVNQIGESGQYAVGGESIMHVVSESPVTISLTRPKESSDGGEAEYETYTAEAIKVQLYGESDNIDYNVPSNMPPTNGMALAQRGNENATDGRTTSFFIDTTSGNIIMLQNVTTPVLKTEYYGVVIGQLPSDLYLKITDRGDNNFIGTNDPVVYAKYGIFENLIQQDHQGGVIQTARDRGKWDVDVANNREKEYKNELTFFDIVTHNDQLYKCLKSGVAEEPGTGSYWLLLVAKGSDGTSIKVQGSYDNKDLFEAAWMNDDGSWKAPADPSDCYVVGYNLYVWVPNNNTWKDVGPFRGESGAKPYVHFAYATSANGDNMSFTPLSGYDYLGIAVLYDESQPSAGDFTWFYVRGDKGDDAIYLSIDNDSDTMLYSADGTILLTGEVMTVGTLHGIPSGSSNSVTWSDSASPANIEGEEYYVRDDNKITVSKLPDRCSSAAITLIATYKGVDYARVFTVKRITGTAKYDLVCTPNSVSYNKSTHDISSKSFDVVIWKTEQDKDTGKMKRSAMPNLNNTGLTLKINGTDVTSAYGTPTVGRYTFTFVEDELESAYDVSLYLKDEVQDAETVDVSKVYDGLGFDDVTMDYAVNDSFVIIPGDNEWKDTYEEIEPFMEEGKILWIRTAFVRNEGEDDEFKTRYMYSATRIGAKVELWELELSSNSINLPTTEYIDVKVLKTTAAGTVEYDNSATLLEKEGCKVMFSVDEQNDLHEVELYSGTDITFDDGTTIFFDDDNQGSLILENTLVNVNDVRSHIWVWVVNANNPNDVKIKEQIKVFRKDSSLTIEYDSPFNIYVDGETGQVLYSETLYTNCRFKLSGELQPLERVIYTVTPDSVTKETIGDYNIQLSFDVTTGQNKRDIIKEVVVSAKVKGNDSITAEAKIPVVFQERGFTGPMGQDGSMIYPYGNWSKDALEERMPGDTEEYAYKLVKKSVTDDIGNSREVIVGRPVVYYAPNNDEKGVYYILQKDLEYSVNNNDGLGLSPNRNPEYWDAVTEMKYLFVEALFAQYAKLAHAIVWGKYLFSKDGYDKDGNAREYGDFKEPGKMFDNEGNFTCEFIPNLYINFDEGKFYGKDVEVTGRINAEKGGKIGGFEIGTTELYTGSSEDYTDEGEPISDDQAILSPSRVRIQHSTNNGNYRVSFGENAVPGNSNDIIDTIGYIKKVSTKSVENEEYFPTVQIDSQTSNGNGVSLRTTGAIVSTGGQVEIGRVIKSAGDYSKRYHDWRIEEGSRLCVRNLRDTGFYTYTIYLPSSESIRKFLGTNDYNYVVSLKLIVSMDNTDSGSPTIVLKPEVNDAESSLRKMIFNGVSLEEPKITLSAGKVYDIEFMSFLADGQGSEGNVSIDWIVNG